MRLHITTAVVLVTSIGALPMTGYADESGAYDVTGFDGSSGGYRAAGTIGALVGGRRQVHVQRGSEVPVDASATPSGASLSFSATIATPGVVGALDGTSGSSRRALVLLEPGGDGTWRAAWRDETTRAVIRREIWRPTARPGVREDDGGGHLAPPPTLDPARPDEAAVGRLLADASRDMTIDASEASALGAFTKAATGKNERVAAYLGALANDPRVTPDAARILQDAAAGRRPNDVPLVNRVYEVTVGPSPFLEDDTLTLNDDGSVSGDTGIRSHSRGYAAKTDGVLFTRHGSLAPAHPATTSAAETAALQAQGPDAALDRAAAIGGVKLSSFGGFAYTARSKAFFDPGSTTPDWAGICQGWTHNALDNRLDVLVDPAGAEGARGLWIFGQWVSRADLGNALMGASFAIGVADSVTIDSFVTPEKLVKALAENVLQSGKGLRVDIWNDVHNPTGVYNPQIWNQPIVAGGISVSSISSDLAARIIAKASALPRPSGFVTPLPADARVKLVRANARWGAETSDAWEREAGFRSSVWNMYMITTAQGKVIRGFMAYDLAAAGVTGLPVTTSDGLPDYMAVPRHEATDAAFSGAAHRLLDPGNQDALRFRLLVGTVLARGIPEPTRAAFEAEALAPGANPAALATRYPGIANAYSPEQWARVFESKLGPGSKFGAVWTR